MHRGAHGGVLVRATKGAEDEVGHAKARHGGSGAGLPGMDPTGLVILLALWMTRRGVNKDGRIAVDYV